MSLRLSVVLFSTFAAASLGCSDSPDDVDTDGGGNDDPDAAVGTPDATVDAAPPNYCDDLPALPTTHVQLGYVPPAEDFTFDTAGNLVGVSLETSALTHTPYGGPPQSIVPGISGFARGTRYLASGDLLVADPETATLKKISPGGSVTPVISGLPDPNGLAIGRDGFAYLTHGGGQLRRIDPNTGDYTVLVNTPSQSYDGITFSLDYETLYFDEESGVVHALDLDTGNVSDLTTLAIGDLLDGMTMDECGNLYVVEMGGVIWRVTPEGAAERYYQFGGGGPPGGGFVFLPAVNFGSGIGGWKRDSLYIMSFEGGVFEVDTGGVRGRLEPHLAGSP